MENKNYEALLKSYREEIENARKAHAPKSIIEMAERNIKTIERMVDDYKQAKAEAEADITEEEYASIRENYREELDKNNSFLHRANKIAQYLGQSTYNFFAGRSYEHRKAVLDRSVADGEELVEKRQNKLAEKQKAIAEAAEKRLEAYNKKHPDKPLKNVKSNLSRFYTAREEKMLNKLEFRLRISKKDLSSDKRELSEIAKEIKAMQDRAQGYFKDSKGIGDENSAIEEQIEQNAASIKSVREAISQEKQETLDKAAAQFEKIMEQTRESLKKRDMEANVTKRKTMIKEMRNALDDEKHPENNDKYVMALSVMPDDRFTTVSDLYRNTKDLRPDAFRAAVMYARDDNAVDIDKFYKDFNNAKDLIKKQRDKNQTKVIHKEASMKDKELKKSAPDKVEFDMSDFLSEKTPDEMPLQELNESLDKQRKKVKDLQKDLNRAQQALDRAERKMEQFEDIVPKKVQKEYDEADKAYDSALAAYNDADKAFKEMKEEKKGRTAEKKQYLPKDLDKKLEPSEKAKREARDERDANRDDDDGAR